MSPYYRFGLLIGRVVAWIVARRVPLALALASVVVLVLAGVVVAWSLLP